MRTNTVEFEPNSIRRTTRRKKETAKKGKKGYIYIKILKIDLVKRREGEATSSVKFLRSEKVVYTFAN